MNYSIQAACVTEDLTLLEAMKRIDISPRSGGPVGVALVCDCEGHLSGLVTDGNIRRLILQGADLQETVGKHMNNAPLTIDRADLSQLHPLEIAKHLTGGRADFYQENPNKLLEVQNIVVTEKGAPVAVITPLDLVKSMNSVLKNVCVVGMGYVGLTLAAVMADEGFTVHGVEANPQIRDALRAGEAHFHEVGLDAIIRRYHGNRLKIHESIKTVTADVYIISVGTPVDESGIPQMNFVESAAQQISENLKSGDLVIVRSTVPIGTCRNVIKPILEQASGLACGEGFHLVFAPERTIEGKALQELRELPQAIGGVTNHCVQVAVEFFSVFAPTIVRTYSLEGAELLKLLNNSFRDVSFAFANQISMLCESIGIDSSAVIMAANEGYPRNRIPVPSPGVGGTCLKKDPYILAGSGKEYGVDVSLVAEARRINEQMPRFISDIFEAFLDRHRLGRDSKIFILGVAFKGMPETSDMRNSTALDLIRILQEKGADNIVVYDPVVSAAEISGIGLHPTTVQDGFREAHIVCIMNNHPSYLELDVSKLLADAGKPVLFFDGWHQFKPSDVEWGEHMYYQGLGTQRDGDK